MKSPRLTEKVSIRLDKPTLAKTQHIADREQRKLSEVVRRLFYEGLRATVAGEKS
jgi:hypothetical protein